MPDSLKLAVEALERMDRCRAALPEWAANLTSEALAQIAALRHGEGGDEPSRGPSEGWRPTHRHMGRGTDYQLIGTALLQWSPQLGDMDPVTIYRDEHGQTWVRGSDEFNDGRFQPLPAPPSPGENR